MLSLLSLLGKANFSKKNISKESGLEDAKQWTASFEHQKPLSFYLKDVSSHLIYCANRSQVEFLLVAPTELKTQTLEEIKFNNQIIMSLRSFEDYKSSLYTGPLQIMVSPTGASATSFLWTVTLSPKDIEHNEIKDPADFLQEYLQKLLKNSPVTTLERPASFEKDQELPDKKTWNYRIKKALTHLKNEEDLLNKIVLSRAITYQCKRDIDLIELFTQMAKNAQGVFKVLIKNKGHQFLSFSPESLHELQGHNLKLEAIAGTRPRVDEDNANAEILNAKYQQELLNDPKELEEHQRVIDQLLEKSQGLGQVSLGETGILELKSLYHLRTPIEVRLNKISQLLEVIDSLHPTPAVCGTPAPLSHKLIGEIEGKRGFYAGLLGVFAWPSNTKEEAISHSTVLIRSLTVKDNKITAFGGAGIVKDSLAENEWNETGNKIDSFMSLLKEENYQPDQLEERTYNKGHPQENSRGAQLEN